MATSRYANLEDYLASLSTIKATTLRAIVQFILTEFPELGVKISWNVPQIHRSGDYVFGLSSSTKHLSLAPWSVSVIDAYRRQLEDGGYVVKKNLFQVADDWDIDQTLIAQLVRARLGEL